MIVNPWAASLFGTVDTTKLRFTQQEAEEALRVYQEYFNKLLEAGDRVDLVYLGTTGKTRYHLVEVLVRPDIDHRANTAYKAPTACGKHKNIGKRYIYLLLIYRYVT